MSTLGLTILLLFSVRVDLAPVRWSRPRLEVVLVGPTSETWRGR